MGIYSLLAPTRGRMSRGPYLRLGISMLLLKFAIDHFFAAAMFGRAWEPINYLIPIDSFSLFSLPANDRYFVLAMCWIALPFALVGLTATSPRLRDVGLPQWLVVLFFFPVINLLFFAVLGLLPGESAEVVVDDLPSTGAQAAINMPPPSSGTSIEYASSAITRAPDRFWSRFFPEDLGTSRLMAAAVPVPLCVVAVLMTATVFRNYGLGAFVGLPFCCGLITSVLHGYSKPRTFAQCLAASTQSLILSGAACILFAIEGLACLLMASPIMFVFMAVGAALGHAIQSRPKRPAGIPNALWTVLIVLPFLMGFESLNPAPPTVFSVTTSIEVNAAPQAVWRRVVSFPQLAAPTEWLFRMGIAYPIRARIDGVGPGAIRRCEFSTGPFIEPIRVWDEPHLLAFDVTSSPSPMQEWSPYHYIRRTWRTSW